MIDKQKARENLKVHLRLVVEGLEDIGIQPLKDVITVSRAGKRSRDMRT